MFSGVNNQYTPGKVPDSFNMQSCGLHQYQPGICNPQYVAGIPYFGSSHENNIPQSGNYPQQPFITTNYESAWNQPQVVVQGNLGFGGLNQQINQGQFYPGYNSSYDTSGQGSIPPAFGGSGYTPIDVDQLRHSTVQDKNIPTQPIYQPHQPMHQDHNAPAYDGSTQQTHDINFSTTVDDQDKSIGISPENRDQHIAKEMSFDDGHRGTMKPYNNFNAESDCNVLRAAMKGIGTDEKAIIECLGRRNLNQRLEIKKTYKTMFGKDLIDCLKSELSHNFRRVVIESLYDSDYYDAYSLHKAMEGAGTREEVLTEILTSRTNEEIENIKEIYQKFFKKELEKDVISETSGFYKRVLVSCLQANKKELSDEDYHSLRQHGPSAVVNVNLASQEAAELFNAGEKKLGTDEAIFIKVFATRNRFQLRATFNAYEKISGHNIIAAIDNEMSGDLASALKAIALLNMNEPLYFASRLYKSMKGAGTNDTALIRIILSRSEIDLENIKKAFLNQYNQTLEAFVKDDISGEYCKYLMRYIEGN